MEEEIEKIETLTTDEAGRMIGKSGEFIRAGLRAQRKPFIDFGAATPPQNPGGRWNYIVFKTKFLMYLGVIKGEVNTNEKVKRIS